MAQTQQAPTYPDEPEWDWVPDFPIEDLPEQCPVHDAPLVYEQAQLFDGRGMHLLLICAVHCPRCGKEHTVVLQNSVTFRNTYYHGSWAAMIGRIAGDLRVTTTFAFYRHLRTGWRIFDKATPASQADAFVELLARLRQEGCRLLDEHGKVQEEEAQ